MENLVSKHYLGLYCLPMSSGTLVQIQTPFPMKGVFELISVYPFFFFPQKCPYLLQTLPTLIDAALGGLIWIYTIHEDLSWK